MRERQLLLRGRRRIVEGCCDKSDCGAGLGCYGNECRKGPTARRASEPVAGGACTNVGNLAGVCYTPDSKQNWQACLTGEACVADQQCFLHGFEKLCHCELDHQCPGGFCNQGPWTAFTDDGRCGTPRAAGAYCENANWCQAGLACANNVCVAPASKHNWEACSADVECMGGKCFGGECRCESHAQCAADSAFGPNSYCNLGTWLDVAGNTEGQCQAPKRPSNVQAECEDGAWCASGLCGYSGRLVKNICYAPLSQPEGAICDLHEHCASGECVLSGFEYRLGAARLEAQLGVVQRRRAVRQRQVLPRHVPLRGPRAVRARRHVRGQQLLRHGHLAGGQRGGALPHPEAAEQRRGVLRGRHLVRVGAVRVQRTPGEEHLLRPGRAAGRRDLRPARTLRHGYCDPNAGYTCTPVASSVPTRGACSSDGQCQNGKCYAGVCRCESHAQCQSELGGGDSYCDLGPWLAGNSEGQCHAPRLASNKALYCEDGAWCASGLCTYSGRRVRNICYTPIPNPNGSICDLHQHCASNNCQYQLFNDSSR